MSRYREGLVRALKRRGQRDQRCGGIWPTAWGGKHGAESGQGSGARGEWVKCPPSPFLQPLFYIGAGGLVLMINTLRDGGGGEQGRLWERPHRPLGGSEKEESGWREEQHILPLCLQLQGTWGGGGVCAPRELAPSLLCRPRHLCGGCCRRLSVACLNSRTRGQVAQ